MADRARLSVREYLGKHDVEAILRQAVAAVVERRPADPVLAIGRLLSRRGAKEEALGDGEEAPTSPTAEEYRKYAAAKVAPPAVPTPPPPPPPTAAAAAPATPEEQAAARKAQFELYARAKGGPPAAAAADPRGLADPAPGLDVDPKASQLALDLAAGALSRTLTELTLKKAGLEALPPQIGSLRQLTKLDVSMCPLADLPPEMSQLGALRIFFALGARFTTVPPVVASLPSLYMLSFKSNRLTHIAEGALAPTIEWLILTDNQLRALPEALPLGLRKVMLTNNKLTALPAAIVRCTNLELIRLSDNQLTALPEGFLSMPKLSWVALAGNPLLAAAATGAPPLPPPTWIAHDDLEIGEMLGAGGGGFVHRASWRQAAGAAPVACAVKLFRGAATVTDGDPAHEIDLGSALSHPCVINVLGALPPPKLGLVLELLDVSAPLIAPWIAPWLHAWHACSSSSGSACAAPHGTHTHARAVAGRTARAHARDAHDGPD